MLDVSPRTLRRWIGAHVRGELRGRVLWVALDDVQRLAERLGLAAPEDQSAAAVRAFQAGATLPAVVCSTGLAVPEVERLASWWSAWSRGVLVAPEHAERLALALGVEGEQLDGAELVRRVELLRVELLRALARAPEVERLDDAETPEGARRELDAERRSG